MDTQEREYVAVPYTVTIDHRSMYAAKREQWDRDALREQCFRQSERTVAGARADFTQGPLTEADQYALDETLDGRVQVAE